MRARPIRASLAACVPLARLGSSARVRQDTQVCSCYVSSLCNILYSVHTAQHFSFFKYLNESTEQLEIVERGVTYLNVEYISFSFICKRTLVSTVCFYRIFTTFSGKVLSRQLRLQNRLGFGSGPVRVGNFRKTGCNFLWMFQALCR